jgi:hypothetical protein
MRLTIITDDNYPMNPRGRGHKDGSDALSPGRGQRTWLVCDLDRCGGAYPGKVLARYRTRRDAVARLTRETVRLMERAGPTEEFDCGPMTSPAEAIRRYAIPDSEVEAIADATVRRRLATDPAFRDAETVEAQAEREKEIAEQVRRELRAEEER